MKQEKFDCDLLEQVSTSIIGSSKGSLSMAEVNVFLFFYRG